MFAYEIPGLRFSLPAGGAVARHRFVAASSDKAIQAVVTSQVIGVSMNEVTAEENTAGGHIVEIADGLVMVEAAGAISSGAIVYPDANGKATATQGSNAVQAGIAITSASTAGELITVKVN